MAEYKGKLLKGLFKPAKNILLDDGTPITDLYTVDTKLLSNVPLVVGYKDISIDVDKSGYEPKGVVGIQFASIDRSKIAINNFYPYKLNDTWYVSITVKSETTATIGGIVVHVLYQKV